MHCRSRNMLVNKFSDLEIAGTSIVIAVRELVGIQQGIHIHDKSILMLVAEVPAHSVEFNAHFACAFCLFPVFSSRKKDEEWDARLFHVVGMLEGSESEEQALM